MSHDSGMSEMSPLYFLAKAVQPRMILYRMLKLNLYVALYTLVMFYAAML